MGDFSDEINKTIQPIQLVPQEEQMDQQQMDQQNIFRQQTQEEILRDQTLQRQTRQNQQQGADGAVLEQQAREQNLRITIKRVEGNLPGPLPKAVKEKIGRRTNIKQQKQKIPRNLDQLLSEVGKWEKVKAETSAPIKDLAKKVREAKTDTDAAASMAFLYYACVNYLYKNNGKWFKSAKRKQAVTGILDSINSFMKGDARSVYQDEMDKQMIVLQETIPEAANVYDFMRELTGLSVESTGEDFEEISVETLRQRAARNKEKERQLSESLENSQWESVDHAAKSILAARETDENKLKAKMPVAEFHFHVKDKASDTPENRQKDAQLAFKRIKDFKIPDFSNMSDYDILSQPAFEEMRNGVYREMANDASRLIAFGYAKDFDEIRTIKSKIAAIKMALDIYDMRLKVMAGETGDLELAVTDGYGLSQEELVKLGERAFDERQKKDIEKFKGYYEFLHSGRQATEEELAARRLKIEKRRSFKSYVMGGYNDSITLANIPAKLRVNPEQNPRTMGGVITPGRKTYMAREAIKDQDGNITDYRFVEKEATDEWRTQITLDIQSDDMVTRFSAYRQVIDDFVHKDYSLLYDVSDEEHMYEHYLEKRQLMMACDEMVKFITEFVESDLKSKKFTDEQREELRKMGFPLSNDERAQIIAISQVGATISQTVSNKFEAVRGDNSELLSLSDVETVENKDLKEMLEDPSAALLSAEEYGHKYGEEAHQTILRMVGAKSFSAQGGVKVGEDIQTLKDKFSYECRYEGFEDIVSGDRITTSLEEKKKAKLLYSITNKKYEGKKAFENIQKDADRALSFISKYAKPINRMSRKDLFKNLASYKQAFLQCAELEAFSQKHGFAILEDEQKTIDTVKANYESYDAYITEYAKLIVMPGMQELNKLGFRLGEGDSLGMGMSLKKIRSMESLCKTKTEKDAYAQLLKVAEGWRDLCVADPTLLDAEMNTLTDKIQGAEKLTDGALAEGQKDYDKVFDDTEEFIKIRAKADGIDPDNATALNVVISSRFINKVDAETVYDVYKTLVKANADCSEEDLAKKAGIIEDILKATLEFGKDDLQVEEGQQYYGKLDQRHSKYILAANVKNLYGDYKNILADKRFEEESFDGDLETQTRIQYHVGALDRIASRAIKPENAVVSKKVSIKMDDVFEEEEERVQKAIEKNKHDEQRREIIRQEERRRKEIEEARKKEREEKEQRKLEKQKEQEEAERLRQQQKEEAGETVVEAAPKQKLNKKQIAARRRAHQKAVNRVKKATFKKVYETKKVLEEGVKNVKENLQAQKQEQILANVTVEKRLLTTEQKQSYAKRMTLGANRAKDDTIHFRETIPLDVKKKVDYLTYEKMSQVAFLFGGLTGQKELESLITNYAQSKEENAKVSKMLDAESAYKIQVTALDRMSAGLLKLDLSKYDVSSDFAISKNATDLETLCRAMDSYQKFLEEAGGNKYIEYLKGQGESGQLIIDRINKLTSLTSYARARMLIMEDETYINNEGADISTEVNENDDYETARLRKLQKLSETYETDMKNAFAPEQIVPMAPMEVLAMERKELNLLEQQRYSVAPEWLKNSLSLTNLKQRNENENPFYCTALSKKTVNPIYEYETKKAGNQAFQKAMFKDIPKMMGTKFIGAEPHFKGGKDKYLGTLSVADNWNRMHMQFTNALSYRRTPDEMKEMLATLKIQEMPEWETIKDDPEAVAFYESAYKEMAMREIASVYANNVRVVNSVGYKIMVMHPADLAMQMSGELKVQLQGALVSQNIDTGEQSLEQMKKLFDENNTDGRYDFDVDFFHQMGGLTANASWKSTNNSRVFTRLLDCEMETEQLDENADESEILKILFGREDIREVAEKEFEEALKKDPHLEYTAGGFYLFNHPELVNMNNFLKKAPNGQFIFGAEMESNTKSYFNAENMRLIRELKAGNKIKPLDEKELAAYEKSLKDRNMPKVAAQHDPYGIEAYRKNFETYLVKDEKKQPVLDKKGKIKMINLLNEKHWNWEED